MSTSPHFLFLLLTLTEGMTLQSVEKTESVCHQAMLCQYKRDEQVIAYENGREPGHILPVPPGAHIDV